MLIRKYVEWEYSWLKFQKTYLNQWIFTKSGSVFDDSNVLYSRTANIVVRAVGDLVATAMRCSKYAAVSFPFCDMLGMGGTGLSLDQRAKWYWFRFLQPNFPQSIFCFLNFSIFLDEGTFEKHGCVFWLHFIEFNSQNYKKSLYVIIFVRKVGVAWIS